MHRCVVILALVLLACSGGTEPCETDILEAEFDNAFYDVTQDIVERMEGNGWDCTSESIRNAFGTAIGTKWTCEKC